MRSRGEIVAEMVGFLADCPLFTKISQTSLVELAQNCRFKSLEKGEVLFFQLDPSDAAYVMRSGKVSIILNSPDGREMVINQMKTGELFGELGIITKRPRSTSAIAHTSCELLVIPGDVFLSIVEKEPQFSLQVLEVTAQRLQMSGKRESALAFMDAQARLAHLLLEMERQEKEKGYVTASQEELAQHTGLIRQTVAKALGKWRREGWLITGRGRILILDRNALEELESNLLV